MQTRSPLPYVDPQLYTEEPSRGFHADGDDVPVPMGFHAGGRRTCFNDRPPCMPRIDELPPYMDDADKIPLLPYVDPQLYN